MNKRQHLNFVAFFSKPAQEGGSYEASWRWQPPDKLKKSFLEDTFKDWEPEVKQLITVSQECISRTRPSLSLCFPSAPELEWIY
jgi:hypothetical protein